MKSSPAMPRGRAPGGLVDRRLRVERAAVLVVVGDPRPLAGRPPPRRRGPARRAARAGRWSCRRRSGPPSPPARRACSVKSTPASTGAPSKRLAMPRASSTTCESRGGGATWKAATWGRAGPRSAMSLRARSIRALRLGAPRLHAPAQPGQLVGDPAIPLVLGPLGQRLAGELLLQIGLVVAGVAGHAGTRGDLHDPVHQIVEEVAVVRHQEERPGEAVQLLLQPVHRVGVEVVGGLVEEQQVGAGEERPGDGHPLARAARTARPRAGPSPSPPGDRAGGGPRGRCPSRRGARPARPPRPARRGAGRAPRGRSAAARRAERSAWASSAARSGARATSSSEATVAPSAKAGSCGR